MTIDVTQVISPELVVQIGKIIRDGKDDTVKHETYKACKDHAEEMSWHVYGSKPERLLNRARPREDQAIRDYRLNSYEPITQSVCRKALTIVHKIFDPNLYSITFDENLKQAQELEEYSMEYYPNFNSVVNYVANYLLKKVMADPNAIILVQPWDYLLKSTERVKPIATCYASCDVYLKGPDYYLLFDKITKTEKGGDIHWFTYVDKNSIIKFNVTLGSSQNDSVFTTVASYAHGFNEVPVWFLSGDYSDGKLALFQSFFYPAVPFWNEAINDHSDVTGAYRMHMWPQKWEVADECEYVEEGESGKFPCNGGYIFDGQTKHKCPACGGSGYSTAKSPYEVHQVNRDKFLGTEGTANIQVPFGYVTVPVDATKMLEEKAEKNLQKGLEALNMDVINEIGLNQSGKAKEMDRTELNDFLKRISSVMYDLHLTNIFYYFAKYMFGVTDPESIEKIEPEISKPTQFDIYSSTELTEQFSSAKTAKLNPSYLTVKQAEIQNKEFQTNKKLLDSLNLQLALDPLAEVDPDTVALMLANQTITKETAIIHDNIRTFVSRALEEDPKFPEKKPSEQRDILSEFAKEVVEENKVKIDMSAIAPPGSPGAPPISGKPPVPNNTDPNNPPPPVAGK